MKLLVLSIILSLLIALALFSGCGHNAPKTADNTIDSNYFARLLGEDEWKAPDTSTIPHDEHGDLIRYGRELIIRTGAYFGPRGSISHAANGMNCQNCHLDAGTMLYANTYSAVYSIYPKFRARSGSVENLNKRINDCMERSMNGKTLDTLSREVSAMKAYINWVGKDVKKGVAPQGYAVVDLPYLDRPADPKLGEIAFQKNCVECHGKNGDGKLGVDSITYEYPPLWGPRSFNTAAGLYRITRMAGFIKSNMPYKKSTHDKPLLTDEEAWDIAAYLITQPRPVKKFKDDWPDISKKPVDHPFGPFTDSFTEEQHKYGPFKQIADASKKKNRLP